MPSTKLSALGSIGTGQAPTDLLYIADLSLGAAGSLSITLNNLLSKPTRGITDGAVRWGGIAGGAEPAVAGASEGSIYYNLTDQAFKASENAAAYDALVLATKTQTLTNKTLGSVTVITVDNATVAAADTILDIRHSSTGAPAAGFGSAIRFGLESTTTLNRQSGLISSYWVDPIDASLRSAMALSVIDVTTAREWARALVPSAGNTQVYLGQLTAALVPGSPTTSSVNVIGTQAVTLATANTASATTVLAIEQESSGTPASGFGSILRFNLESSTTAAQPAGNLVFRWNVATHASRSSEFLLQVYEQGTPIDGFRMSSLSGIPQFCIGINPFLPGINDGIISFTGSVRTVPVTLVDAATIATDASQSNNFSVTLTDNRTLGNPTFAADGQVIVWELIQDAVGNRTLALDTNFQLGTDISSVTLSTTANARDFLTCKYSASTGKFYVVAFVKGY